MVERGVERELLDFCLEEEIGVIVYSPMKAGLLTGKFSRKLRDSLPEDDWRWKSPHFDEPRFSATLKLVDRLRPLAGHADRTLAELAIAWVLRRPAVTSAIVGARRPDQIEQTALAGDWDLTSAEIDRIEEWLAEWEAGINA